MGELAKEINIPKMFKGVEKFITQLANTAVNGRPDIQDPIFDIEPQVVFNEEMMFDPIGKKKLGHADISCEPAITNPKDCVRNLLKNSEASKNYWCVEGTNDGTVIINFPSNTPNIGGFGFKSSNCNDTHDPIYVVIVSYENGKCIDHGSHSLNWRHRRLDTIKVDLDRPIAGKKVEFYFTSKTKTVMLQQIRFDKAK